MRRMWKSCRTMLAHLQLKDYWIDELVFRDGGGPGPETSESSSLPVPRVEFGVSQGDEEDGENFYLVHLRVSAGKAKALKGLPYEFRIGVYGAFTVAPGLSEDERYRLVHLNGPAMLCGVARGAIATVTASGRNGKYILPSINVLAVLKRQERRRAQSTEHEDIVSE